MPCSARITSEVLFEARTVTIEKCDLLRPIIHSQILFLVSYQAFSHYFRNFTQLLK